MDCEKIGKLIASLRRERNMTQRELADALGVLPKTVSKWECGSGCPDLALWPALSTLLGADLAKMMAGEITPNRPDAGAVHRGRLYVCPVCGNLLFSTGRADVSCCGRTLDPLPESPREQAPAMTVQEMDGELYLTWDHPMRKDHYLAFVAYLTGDLLVLRRLYPEQDCAVRLPQLPLRGDLYVYCTRDGLFRYPRPLLKSRQ